MKRIIKLLLISAFSLLLVISLNHLPGVSLVGIKADHDNVAFAAETKITTVSLNLRTGPGTNYSIILTMPKGSTVTVLSTSASWSKVTYNGTTGYAYSPYLASPTSASYVTTASVNLRTGPSTNYSVILTIPKGASVSVHSIVGNWANLTYNGKTGYSYLSYLAPASGTRYYTTTSLNLRTGPGTGYSIILTMPKGSPVTVYSITSSWARLTYNGQTGYAYSPYLSKTAPTSDPSPDPTSIRKIYKGITSYSGKRIAITFDDGASSSYVNQVLDILDRYNARSTFFFTGDWINSHPITARKIVSRGHKMESHTVSHPSLTSLTDSQVRYQLTKSREIIKETVGTTATMIRPPYGNTSDRVERIAGELGYKYMVMWSIDTDDYKSTSTAASITRKAVEGATNNGILLLHPAHYRVVQALPDILSQLRDKGYVFTTVNAMVP